jgi:multidrug efflux pump subunit AcrA (membrane-fusion protein)
MKKAVIGVVLLAVVGAGVYVYRNRSASDASDPAAATGGGRGGGANGANGQARGGAGGRRGGGAGGFGGQFGRPPLTVELAKAVRATIQSEITVVGNLIGQATVSVAPRAAGRVETVTVQLGDRVSRGQRLAKIEDFDIQEQVKQAEAAQQVSEATIRQREADLKLAQTNAERSRSLYERQLLPKQTLDDNEARYQSAVASVDLARAQSAQSRARLDELRINLANTIISSPVNGFVSKRSVDPAAFVSQNVRRQRRGHPPRCAWWPTSSRRISPSSAAATTLASRSTRFPAKSSWAHRAVSPVLDPATRTARSRSRSQPHRPPQAGNVRARQRDHEHAQGNARRAGHRRSSTPRRPPRCVHTAQRNGGRSAPRHRHRAERLVKSSAASREGDTVITTGSSACATATASCGRAAPAARRPRRRQRRDGQRHLWQARSEPKTPPTRSRSRHHRTGSGREGGGSAAQQAAVRTPAPSRGFTPGAREGGPGRMRTTRRRNRHATDGVGAGGSCHTGIVVTTQFEQFPRGDPEMSIPRSRFTGRHDVHDQRRHHAAAVISLTRLPVDLMPEFEQPQLTVRTTTPGSGPLEMEELITRPMEQAVSAVPGCDARRIDVVEGNSQVRLNFDWGTDLSEAADEVRTRVDRMRNRLPEDADPPTIFKFDSNTLPIMQARDRGRLRPGDAARAGPERDLAALRARGRRGGGERQRRPAAPDPRRASKRRSPRSTCR